MYCQEWPVVDSDGNWDNGWKGKKRQHAVPPGETGQLQSAGRCGWSCPNGGSSFSPTGVLSGMADHFAVKLHRFACEVACKDQSVYRVFTFFYTRIFSEQVMRRLLMTTGIP
jgi:hypothetical protein